MTAEPGDVLARSSMFRFVPEHHREPRVRSGEERLPGHVGTAATRETLRVLVAQSMKNRDVRALDGLPEERAQDEVPDADSIGNDEGEAFHGAGTFPTVQVAVGCSVASTLLCCPVTLSGNLSDTTLAPPCSPQ